MYGNYKGYYKRRNVEDRFRFLEREWFEGKACIDIGCNEGRVTATIAERFQPRMIIGIDKDGLLIDSAQSMVKRFKYQHVQEQPSQSKAIAPTTMLFKPRALISSKSKPATSTKRPDSEVIITTTEVKQEEEEASRHDAFDGEYDASADVKHFPFNVVFARKDVFDLSITVGERYDTILCLSVTKWIHLHRGDEGLMQFFQLVHRLLKKGGIFVLEYQQWNSYKKRKSVTEETERIFHEIHVVPDTFEAVLVQQVGFTVMRRYAVDTTGTGGFNNRPILVLTKA